MTRHTPSQHESTSQEQEPYGQDGRAQPPPTSDPKARRIAEVSPEGIPADPDTDRRTIGRTLTFAFAIVAIIAVLLAIFVHPWVGLICGVLAILLMLVNPVLWASFSRMKEREQV